MGIRGDAGILTPLYILVYILGFELVGMGFVFQTVDRSVG